MNARSERVLLWFGGIVSALILLALASIAGLFAFALVYSLFHLRH
jgi:hypothetical protein